ncbi:MAG: hypothetical protein KBB94_03795 [Legionellaceae bacterium]|nr:hypothetical protein [Legionellaceae bacterium]MBP9774199.1 hypothetical protein [Legionellaceae bacterium]
MTIKDILKPLINSIDQHSGLNAACNALIAAPNSQSFAELEACCAKILSTMKDAPPEYRTFETKVLDAIKALYQANLCRDLMVNQVVPKGKRAGLRASQEVVITSLFLRKVVAREMLQELEKLEVSLKAIRGCPQNQMTGPDNVIVLADIAINKFIYASYEEKTENSFTYCKQVLEEICKKFSSPEKDLVMGTNVELLMYGDIRYFFAVFRAALDSITRWVTPGVRDTSYNTESAYQPRFFTLEFASHQALREFKGATADVETQYGLMPVT